MMFSISHQCVARSLLLLVAMALAACQSTPRPYDPYVDADVSRDGFETAGNRPPTPRTLRAMARILASQGKEDQANYVLSTLIQRHPKYMPAYNDLAELQLRGGNADEALQTLNAGLRIAPQDATLWNNRGMCFLLKAQYDDALQAFDAAVEHAPDNARYHSNRAVALGMLGRYNESLEAYGKVVSPAQAHHNVSVLAAARKDTQRAAEERSNALRLGYAAAVETGK